MCPTVLRTEADVRRSCRPGFRACGGAPLVPDNRIRILKDAEEDYPAWLDAIRSARQTIHFESYIIHDDEAGRRFGEALALKAREGVRVRLLYD
jgi:cardiolipin synthase